MGTWWQWLLLSALFLVSCNRSEDVPLSHNLSGMNQIDTGDPNCRAGNYNWTRENPRHQCIHRRIPVPPGFKRVKVNKDSFAEWLRHLPLKHQKSNVLLFNGALKPDQTLHEAVIDINTGEKDLQQCADAIIRLRAEYLYTYRRYDEISFNFTSGDPAEFNSWRAGFRPKISGNQVEWHKSAAADDSYSALQSYLEQVFIYSGTYSLSKELKQVHSQKTLQIGDVFVKGGFPGHAAIVVDMAVDPLTGKRIFLLAQSYSPAQDLHILKNPSNKVLSPWYSADFKDILETPEWTFKEKELKRFH